MKTLYLKTGQQVEVVREVEGGSIVANRMCGERFIYPDDCEEFEYSGEPYYTDNADLLVSPPVEVFAKDVQAMRDQIADLAKERHEARVALEEVQKNIRNGEATAKKLAEKYESLRDIEEFIENGIPYVVVDRYSVPQIVKAGDVDSIDDDGRRWEKALKMLSFVGSWKGENESPRWMLAGYSDGSGSWTNAAPCRSEEHAIDVIRTMLLKHVASDKGISQGIYERCMEHGVVIPEPALTKYKESKVASRGKEIERTKQDIARYQEKLKKLQVEAENERTLALL